MIKQAELFNLQPHKYSLLDFCNGVNIIKGRSHSGKSSIVRGFKWAITDNPRGDDLRNDNTPDNESFAVALLFSEGTYISREKNHNKKVNLYRLSDSEEPLSAIRTHVPDEVKQITKMGASNIREQGGYFLLKETPGQAAKKLNKVVGIQIIDEKKAKIKRIILDYSSRIKVLDSQIESSKSDLEQDKYKNIEKINNTVLNIERLNKKYSKKEDQFNHVQEILESINIKESVISSFNKTISHEKQILHIRKKIVSSEEMRRKITDVSSLNDAVEDLELEISEHEEIISFEEDIKSIRSKIKRAENLHSAISEIKRLYKDIENKRLVVAHAMQTIEQDELLKSKLEKRLEIEMDHCSKCGAHKQYWQK